MVCLEENDDLGDSTFTSSVFWKTTIGVDYYILVAGKARDESGEYILNVTVCHDHVFICLAIFLIWQEGYLTFAPLYCIREKTAQCFLRMMSATTQRRLNQYRLGHVGQRNISVH